MSWTHLTARERFAIEQLRLCRFSYREIGRRLGRCHTTIMREVRRNGPAFCHDVYTEYRGEIFAKRRRHLARHHYRRNHKPLAHYVQTRLARRWSPEQIVGRLALDFPSDARMRVSVETIYRWVCEDAEKGGTLFTNLRRHHKRRRKQKRLSQARQRFAGRVSIHERPSHIDRRCRYGDWEGDTVLGAKGRGSIVTLVERKSRYLLATPLQNRKAATLSRAASRLLKTMPEHWRKTLTLDNGSEFARFQAIEHKTGMDVYFADPYASWQRGLNENTNGLIRQYLPKGKPMDRLPKRKLESIVNAINNRPRKCLGYRTPNEVLTSSAGAIAM